MRNKLLITIYIIILFIPTISFSQNSSNYLILQDIGPYKLDRPEIVFAGEPPIGGPREYNSAGIIVATGHFPDHPDKTYEVMYIGGNGFPSPTVQTTQHAGSESDKWLMHEVERDFRNYYGLPGRAYSYRIIDGQVVMEDAAGGRNYRWISDNKVIVIEYHDPQMTKPEPIEVVRAYLRKHPSTMKYISLKELRSDENKTRWIKDEMERRLWLCDRWFLALQTGKVEEKTVYRNAVNSMQVFLDYREKYYGISAKSEKQVLWEYLQANNGTGIKDKLQKYKSWWSGNRDKAISVQ